MKFQKAGGGWVLVLYLQLKFSKFCQSNEFFEKNNFESLNLKTLEFQQYTLSMLNLLSKFQSHLVFQIGFNFSEFWQLALSFFFHLALLGINECKTLAVGKVFLKIVVKGQGPRRCLLTAVNSTGTIPFSSARSRHLQRSPRRHENCLLFSYSASALSLSLSLSLSLNFCTYISLHHLQL